MTEKTYLKVSAATKATLPDSFALRRLRLRWDPTAFVIEHERMEHKIIEASVQEKSLARFIENPKSPMTYVVAGNPDDEVAKYFATYLLDVHRQRLGINASPHWEVVYNGYDNPVIKSSLTPSLIVLSNLSVKSNYLKYDKARDVIERFPSIPKIVVVAGEDPISFAAQRLHVPCHGIAYFANAKASKSVQEVI
jgi:hypothetical protein